MPFEEIYQFFASEKDQENRKVNKMLIAMLTQKRMSYKQAIKEKEEQLSPKLSQFEQQPPMMHQAD